MILVGLEFNSELKLKLAALGGLSYLMYKSDNKAIKMAAILPAIPLLLVTGLYIHGYFLDSGVPPTLVKAQTAIIN